LPSHLSDWGFSPAAEGEVLSNPFFAKLFELAPVSHFNVYGVW